MIKVREIKKQYKIGSNTVDALCGISFNVNRGDFLTVVGVSGSGKTTLMNILGCLDTATEGTYVLDGEDVSTLGKQKLAYVRNQKIGFVFQGFNLIPTLTARENVELPLLYRKTPKRERDALVDEALETVGLSSRKNHRPSELSGGQQQRTAIARAIAARPPVILADEPCGNLDSKNSASVMGILKELNKSGRTVILITHDEKSIFGGMIRIADGRLI